MQNIDKKIRQFYSTNNLNIMKKTFDFMKWALNNCVNRGLNCLSYDGVIYDLDKEKDQQKLYIQYQNDKK